MQIEKEIYLHFSIIIWYNCRHICYITNKVNIISMPAIIFYGSIYDNNTSVWRKLWILQILRITHCRKIRI